VYAGSTTSTTAVSQLAAPVQSLMQLIFNQQYMADAMTDLNYDADKLPLGKLSKATINRGFQALKDLTVLLSNAVASQTEVEDVSNRYYSLIPHNFGTSPTFMLISTRSSLFLSECFTHTDQAQVGAGRQ
jgi:poly [ADP-ribose] polymerase